MQTGKIKFFNKQKGYGFIIDESTDKEIFVHINGLKNKNYIPEKDHSVTFTTESSNKGDVAVNVEKIK